MFKLYSDTIVDRPLIACDVCSQPIYDLQGDKASGGATKDGTVSDIIIHHAGCTPAQPQPTTIPLADFLRLLAVQQRLGDLSSDGVTDKVGVEYPTGKGFEA